MTGSDPFVPPGDATRPPSAPPSSPLPPPDAATYRGPAAPTLGLPTPPPPPSRPAWVLPVVIGSGALVLAALIGGGALFASSLAPRVFDTVAGDSPLEGPAVGDVPPSADLLEGDPGSPLAQTPFDCVGCFTEEDARALRPDVAAWDRLGLTEGNTGPFWRSLGDEQSTTVDYWESEEVSPDACYFAWAVAPLPSAPQAIPDSDETFDQTIVMSPDRSDPDGFYTGRTGARVFADSTSAVAHMTELASLVAACPNYFAAGSGSGASVTAGPALDLPADVGGYTWAEDSGGQWRYYGADLQRGNLVVRITANSDGWGASESDFRDFVEDYARLLAALEPTG